LKVETDLEILGLKWQSNWHINNGQDSFVVPFASLRPVNLVFHGEEKFNYGHYGIHLGQADCLTFLGSTKHVITGYFIDCRHNSPTLHKRLKIQWHPSSGLSLYIPNGVAHAFDGLEKIFTLNNYHLFLPDPTQWVNGNTEWNIESDVINLPMNISDEDLPTLHANENEASDIFYQLIAERQKASILQLKHEYPFTEDVTLENGKTVRLLLHKQRIHTELTPEWATIEEIEGVGWSRHLVVWSGDHSGFVPLLDAAPFYIVDHGENAYSHDAFGIHLGQEDRLTFLGSKSHKIRLTMVDCRQGSKTLHNKVCIEFSPSSLRYLVIPNGVAHRFEGLEKVFTINRPKVFVTNEDDYEPSNDVIDWSVDRQDFPQLKIHTNPASPTFYAKQVYAQNKLMELPPEYATPMVFLTQDSEGNSVRVALRKTTK
jgi:dTDP-4-dehydrorhamnose 3,5-epimerase-like enzyme